MDKNLLLELSDLPHLRKERFALRLLRVAELEQIQLSLVDGGGGLAYQSVHGTVVTAKETVYRLLDTALEKVLPEVFAPVPARDHWETGESLPAGPGPFGSGFLALGSAHRAKVLMANDWQPPGPDILFEEKSIPTRLLQDEEDDYDEDEESGGPNRAPAAWQELTGPVEAVRGYLYWSFRRDLNDLALDWANRDLKRAQEIEYARAARKLIDGVLTVFPPEESRYLMGCNAGWDRYDEDYLAHDKVIGVVGDEYLLLMYLYYDRWYG
jgi:hypothetical protein